MIASSDSDDGAAGTVIRWLFLGFVLWTAGIVYGTWVVYAMVRWLRDRDYDEGEEEES